MAANDLTLSPSPPTPPLAHFYPFATSPDIIRSHEKDVFITSGLVNQVQAIVRSLRGARFAHAHTEAIKHLTEVLYFSLTTLIGNRTLGEEYCDLVQLEEDTLRLPSIVRRVGYILSTILLPWTLQRILPAFRQRIRAKLQRSIARQELSQAQQQKQQQQTARTARSTSSSTSSWFSASRQGKSGKGKTKANHNASSSSSSMFTKLHLQKYILEHLDSITSLSPIYAVSIATFYFTGSYYHLAKRFWRLRYVFTKRIEENEQRVGYEVLGVLLVLQIAVQAIMHIRQVRERILQEEKENGHATTTIMMATPSQTHQAATGAITSIQNPASLPLLPAETPRYDLGQNASLLPWIPTGQQRKCTLCLEGFKDPSVTTCGHVFCWTCVRDWVREKPECPLCRQEVLLSKVLPLRG